MAWKNVAHVFLGGTAEAKALVGKRIRVRLAMDATPIDVINPQKLQPTIKLAVGNEGFLGGVPADAPAMLRLVFPAGGACPASLDAMMRAARMNVFSVNWPTFKQNFDIDM